MAIRFQIGVLKDLKRRACTTIKNIASLNIRSIWLIFLTYATQIWAFKAWPPAEMVDFKKIVLVFTYFLLLAILSRNLHLWSMRFMAVAAFMNLLAILSNGGLMPISPQAIAAAGLQNTMAGYEVGDLLPHTRAQLQLLEQTRLWFLTDIIPISAIRVVLSPGDTLVLGSLAMFLAEAMRGNKRVVVRQRDGNE